MLKKLFSICFIMIVSLTMFGCAKHIVLNQKTNKLEAPFLSFGPAYKLVKLDDEVMQPVLMLEAEYDKLAPIEKVNWLKKAILKNKENQKYVQATEIIRMNDAYIYFAKKYLKVQEQYLTKALAVEKEKNLTNKVKLAIQLQQFRDIDLFDARLDFNNARKKLSKEINTVKENRLEFIQLHKGMTYAEIRNLLQLTGERLHFINVPKISNQTAKSIEPILWVSGNQFLYVEFVNGKSDTWKLYKGLSFGDKGIKKIRVLVDDCDDKIIQPVWNVYSEYKKAKDELAKKKIYNEAAAKQQKEQIGAAVLKLAAYRKTLDDVPSNNTETKVYLEQSKHLLQLIDERLQCAQRISGDNKDRKYIQQNVNRGNHLEGWEIWRTYYTYQNAKRWLKDGKSSYVFPGWANGQFSKKPWLGSLMHWYKMPSEQLHQHIETDAKNAKRNHRFSTNIWVHQDGYFYGEFIDDRLVKWQYRKVFDGFYN